MHHSQNPAHLAFSGNNPHERFARALFVTECAGYDTEIARNEIGQLRAQIELAFLSQLECAHHCFGMFYEVGLAVRKELPVANNELVHALLWGSEQGQESEERASYS